jgi:two-component system, NarL family, sensor histidine kinase DesK
MIAAAPRPRFTFWQFFPLLWLAFLAYPVLGVLARPRPPAVLLGCGALLAVFLYLFARVFWARGRSLEHQQRWAVAGWGYALLCYLLFSPIAPGTSSAFLIYGASMIGAQHLSTLATWPTVLNMMVMVVPFWTGRYGLDDLSWLAPNLLFTAVAAVANHASYRQRIGAARLTQIQAENERLAADAERERIARDLHDLLGHTLSVIVLKSELASRLTERDPARAAQEIREVEAISRGALSEVRAAVQGYRGSGLSAELARSKVALDAAGVRLTLDTLHHPLPPDLEQALCMVLREAVTNVVRHAQARSCLVRLEFQGARCLLEVSDDGRGGDGPEGSGLTGMRERLRALGGELLRRSGPAGTSLRASIPAPTSTAPGAAPA